MATAEIVREKALSLAGDGPTDEAVREVLDCCQDKRVPVVLARQQLLTEMEAGPSDPMVGKAVALLDKVLERLPLE